MLIGRRLQAAEGHPAPEALSAGGPNPVSMAARIATESTSAGQGPVILSPIGQGVVAAGGSWGWTTVGLKKTESRPLGSAIQPWDPGDGPPAGR